MRCRNCRTRIENKNSAVYSGIYTFCTKDCLNSFAKFFKSVTNKNKEIKEAIDKGRVAEFTGDTRAFILIRDKHCILCEIQAIKEYHHVYYGGEAEHNDNRNHVSKGVGLCHDCHYEMHHGIKGTGQELRRKCIEYVEKLYSFLK